MIIGGVPPYLLKANDNPEGVDASVLKASRRRWPPTVMPSPSSSRTSTILDVLLGKRVSEEAVRAS